jgi:hypothetical protein
MFWQCGILEMFWQCGISEMFWQCGISEMFWQCGIFCFSYYYCRHFDFFFRLLRLYQMLYCGMYMISSCGMPGAWNPPSFPPLKSCIKIALIGETKVKTWWQNLHKNCKTEYLLWHIECEKGFRLHPFISLVKKNCNNNPF